ncbi:MAG: hypothetical protein ACMG6E_05345 [Candidatus Roizmanbacteria bacterium]
MNPIKVFAQDVQVAGQTISGPLNGVNIIGKKIENLGDLTNVILAFLYPAAGLIILFYFIQSGFYMMLSKGNADKFGEAKHKMTFTVIGFVLLMTSFIVVRVLQAIFHVGAGILPN